MGQRPEGWKLTFDARTGIHGVRWRRNGIRVHVSTGERDPAAAAAAAEAIYSKAVSRRQRVGGRAASRSKIGEIGSEWIADLEDSLDEQTVSKYDQYVDAWAAFFSTVADLTGPSIEDFWRTRLREVKRKTVMKQLYALNGFLAWLVSRGALDEVPAYTMPPKSSTGTPGRAEIETVPLSEEEGDRLVAALPEWSERARKGGGGKWRVRDRLTVAWETALRPATLDAIEAPRDFQKGTQRLRIRDEDDKARFGREVPLSPAAAAALDRSAPELGRIFGRVDSHAATGYLREAALAAKLPADKAAKVKPYDLRHARLTLLAESGNLVGVAYLAGHKAITTTNRYVHAHLAAATQVLAFDAARGGTDSGRKRGKKRDG